MRRPWMLRKKGGGGGGGGGGGEEEEEEEEEEEKDASIHVNLIFLFSSTCFGRCFRPLSVELDCIYSIW
jgi:hypothetical protein